MGDKTNRDLSIQVSTDSDHSRLDVFLTAQLKAISRSRIQSLIKQGRVKVNDESSKPGYRLAAGDHVWISIPPAESLPIKPEKVEFGIVHEDSCIIVIDKPPGLVVHPAPGHSSGTLVHGLLHHCSDLSGIGGYTRPGIVHRLDKDTSGLLVVAKTDRAHLSLSEQFKSGLVKKRYLALVHGNLSDRQGTIDLPVGRHPLKRKQMTIDRSRGRNALTIWKSTIGFQCGFSLLSVTIKTGRTHQIRVHLSDAGHPVIGDPLYGYGRRWWKRFRLKDILPVSMISRQMLHAASLGFQHPESGVPVAFESPLPEDMRSVLDILKELEPCDDDRKTNGSMQAKRL